MWKSENASAAAWRSTGQPTDAGACRAPSQRHTLNVRPVRRPAVFLLAAAAVALAPICTVAAPVIHKVAEEGFAGSNHPVMGRIGVPSINSAGISNGRYNLAVDHTAQVPSPLGDGILSFTGCRGDCSTGGNFQFDADQPGEQAIHPSAGWAAHAYAFLNAPSNWGTAIHSNGAPLAPGPGPGTVVVGPPSAKAGQVAFVESVASPSIRQRIVLHDLLTNARTPVIDSGDDFEFIGTSSNPSDPGYLGISTRGGSIVFRGWNSTITGNNGIFRRTIQRHHNGTTTVGPIESIAVGPALGYTTTGAPAYESLPVDHAAGAVWAHSANIATSGDNLFYGRAGTGQSANISQLAPKRLNPAVDVGYGDVASTGGGLVVFEEIAPNGEVTLGMNLIGVGYPRYITPAMVPVNFSQFATNLDIGAQAAVAHLSPFITRNGANIAFYSGLNTAGPKVNDAVFVVDVPEIGIDLGGAFSAAQLERSTYFEATFKPCDPTVMQCIVGGSGDSKGVGGLHLRGSVDDTPAFLGQEHGHSLGVDSSVGEAHLVEDGEALTLHSAHDVQFDKLVLTDFDVDDFVRLTVDSIGLDMEFGFGNRSSQFTMDGLFALDLGFTVPSGAEMVLQSLGGDGWGVSGMIVQAANLAIAGDANNDGVVNTLDIDAFVLAVTNPSQYGQDFPGADYVGANDLNADGVVNTLDVDPFVALLTGGSQAVATPEPATLGSLALMALACVGQRSRR